MYECSTNFIRKNLNGGVPIRTEFVPRSHRIRTDFAADPMEEIRKFPPHQPVRVSKLEALRGEIAEMSRQGWPQKMIREYLAKERGVSVSLSRLCNYCQSRNIKKGRGEVSDSQEVEEHVPPRLEGTQKLPESISSALLPEVEDVTDLLAPTEEKNPFTKFRPNS